MVLVGAVVLQKCLLVANVHEWWLQALRKSWGRMGCWGRNGGRLTNDCFTEQQTPARRWGGVLDVLKCIALTCNTSAMVLRVSC